MEIFLFPCTPAYLPGYLPKFLQITLLPYQQKLFLSTGWILYPLSESLIIIFMNKNIDRGLPLLFPILYMENILYVQNANQEGPTFTVMSFI